MMDPDPGGMTLSEEDRRIVGLCAADCADRVLPLFEAKAPPDTTRARQSGQPGLRARTLNAVSGNRAIEGDRAHHPERGVHHSAG